MRPLHFRSPHTARRCILVFSNVFIRTNLETNLVIDVSAQHGVCHVFSLGTCFSNILNKKQRPNHQASNVIYNFVDLRVKTLLDLSNVHTTKKNPSLLVAVVLKQEVIMLSCSGMWTEIDMRASDSRRHSKGLC